MNLQIKGLVLTRKNKPTIHFVDLAAQQKIIRSKIENRIKNVLNHGKYIMGPEVFELEEKLADYVGVKHCITCSSGTDALLMAKMSLGIKAGDEVILPSFTWVSTAETIALLGAVPVFVDINEKNFNIDIDQLESCITEKTKAIIPVHLFGQCSNMDEIKRIAKKHDLKIIEDAAQAVAAEWKGERAGSMGDTGCFSFFPAKNLGAYGDGGMVTTNSEELYQKMLRTRQHGIDMKNPYHYEHIGGNFRLDALQAGVLNVKLRYIEWWSRQRNENAQEYNSRLNKNLAPLTEGPTPPFVSSDGYHVFNQYVIRSSKRDNIRKRLNDSKIGCNVYYPYPIHTQGCISHFGYSEGDFPVTEKACKEVLALPIYPELTNEEIHRVVDVMEIK